MDGASRTETPGCCRTQPRAELEHVSSKARSLRERRTPALRLGSALVPALFLLVAGALLLEPVRAELQQCYETDGRAKHCFPLYSTFPTTTSPWTANSTCTGATRFCEIDPRNATNVLCDTCSNRNFGTANLADPDIGMSTSWQSDVLASAGDNVALTVPNLSSLYLLQQVHLSVTTPPQSYFIEVSADAGATWRPVVYYAFDCLARYGLPPSQDVSSVPLSPRCEPLFSTAQTLLFQTVSGRVVSGVTLPFEAQSNAAFRQFVTMNSVRIVLDDVRRPEASLVAAAGESLNSFNYHRVASAFVTALLNCNGHAGSVSGSTCVCQHNTVGQQCTECRDFHHDVPWRPATQSEPFECRICNCNGRSTACVFNQTKYNTQLALSFPNPSGGICLGCTDDSRGDDCSLCSSGFYINGAALANATSGYCLPCGCNASGATNGRTDCLQADFAQASFPFNGQCFCKDNVEGRTCDRCRNFAYGFNSDVTNGCTDCRCNISGTIDANNTCDSTSGDCRCKASTTGRQCHSCADGTFNLSASNPDGCQGCLCRLGYAVDNTCQKANGTCTCRPGFENRQCDAVSPGRYVRPVDSLRLEAENSSLSTALYVPSTDQGQFTGRGFARLSVPIQTDVIEVPRTLDYCLIVRYNTSISRQIDVRTTAGSVSRATSVTLSPTATVALVGTVQFLSSTMYRFTITGSAEVLLDSIVLIPQVGQLPQFSANPVGFALFNTSGCDPLCSLSASQSAAMSTPCREVLSLATAELHGMAADCACSSNGSRNTSCDPLTGQCFCLEGLAGSRCDRCASAFYQIGAEPTNCQACDCDPLGSRSPVCDFTGGTCQCQAGRTGRRCDQCLPDYYLPSLTSAVCLQCQCNQTGSRIQQCFNFTGGCACKTGYVNPTCNACDLFRFGFSTECQLCTCGEGSITGFCDVTTGQCPCKNLTMGMTCDTCVSGSHSLSRANPLGCTACNCSGHSSNCTAAIPGGQIGLGRENCYCPVGHEGLSCESCSAGFTKNSTLATSSPSDPCVPCSCHGHAGTCDPITGRCLSCAHNAAGFYCQRCAAGYYGDATQGTDGDCLPCACPFLNTTAGNNVCELDGGAGGSYRCTNCPTGSTGARCHLCQDGFNGNPAAGRPCSDCSCSGNIDRDASGNCNPLTGICSNCLGNTTGSACERCAGDYYGDAVAAKNCTLCRCDANGTRPGTTCNPSSGQCACLAGVEGRRCDSCMANRYGFGNASGCSPCGCSDPGSSDTQCHRNTGACSCRLGAGGRACDTCLDGFYAAAGAADSCANTTFSPCRACCCDASNTVGNDSRCNMSGHCTCRSGSEGPRCNNCSVGFFRDGANGCQSCACNGHSTSCTSATQCQGCRDNTAGNQCQVCVLGHYGDATIGQTTDCQPCRCNGFSAGCVASGAAFNCSSCGSNTTGAQCEQCLPNHYGNPTGGVGCFPCAVKCNGNSVTCSPVTGMCDACQFNTTGENCQLCAAESYGDALQRQCQSCRCDPNGAEPGPCDRVTGTCQCRANVAGDQCTRCQDNHYNLTSGAGCTFCDCHGMGSAGTQCNRTTGLCDCKSRVVGRRCDACAIDSYGLTGFGCTACNCNTTGTVSGNVSCNGTGHCVCEPGTMGLSCDQCQDGFFWTDGGCTACQCSGQSTSCDPVGGACRSCGGNTDGDNCERCAPEFHRVAGDCVECGCHGDGAANNRCNQTGGQCLCRPGVDSAGSRTCSQCQDHFYNLTASGCTACMCAVSGIVAGSVCNETSGQCTCAPGFTGQRCDGCAELHYGYQLGCPGCNCTANGSQSLVCNITNGQCSCLYNVVNRTCDVCQENFYDFGNAVGCQDCQCNSVGSRTLQCDGLSGNCSCKTGVGGAKCDQCLDGNFNFSSAGCQACGCNANGSASPVCDKTTGQCPCSSNVVSRQCSLCQHDHFTLPTGTGCRPCACQTEGTMNATCDAASGLCPCLANVTGRACSQCVDNHYAYPTCLACNCNLNGSFNGSCDDNGRCYCRPNAIGQKCTACTENFLLSTGGCMGCPSCYNITQSQVENVRMRLSVAMGNLSRIMADALLMNFLSRQGNLTNLYSTLVAMTMNASLMENATIRETWTLLNTTLHYSTLYPSSYTDILSRLSREAFVLGTGYSSAKGKVQVASASLQQSQATLNLILTETSQLRRLYQNVVDLGALQERIQREVGMDSSRLRAQAADINGTAQQALDLAERALRNVQAAMATANDTESQLATTGLLVEAASPSAPTAQAAETAVSGASVRAQTALGNATSPFPLASTAESESTASAYTREGGQLAGQALAVDQTNANERQRVSQYNAEVAALQRNGQQASTLSTQLRNRSLAALQTVQAALTAASSAIASAQSDLAMLTNFSLESQAARSRADQSLQAAQSVGAMATAAVTQATAILVEHRNASVDSQNAATASTAAAQSIAAAEQVGQGQAMTTSQLQADLSNLSSSADQLNSSIAAKSQASTQLRTACTAATSQAQLADASVQAAAARAQTADANAQSALREARQLESTLLNIASVPTSSLTSLEQELQNLQGTLTRSQVTAMIPALQLALRQREADLALQETALRSIDAEVQALSRQRDALVSSCQQQLP